MEENIEKIEKVAKVLAFVEESILIALSGGDGVQIIIDIKGSHIAPKVVTTRHFVV